LKSLRSVTLRNPLFVQIGGILMLLNGPRYHENERLSYTLPPVQAKVEHSIGNGEVDSSILSGSTIRFRVKSL
jgi:hypothetical protein